MLAEAIAAVLALSSGARRWGGGLLEPVYAVAAAVAVVVRLRRRCLSVGVCQVRLRQEQGMASRAAPVAAWSPAWSSSGRQQALRNCYASCGKLRCWPVSPDCVANRARMSWRSRFAEHCSKCRRYRTDHPCSRSSAR